eukprot:CAMPEP_0184516592 /NCGR_PEP_ID=MMETSP0198_2-20121128/5113_1 /TAXON_ID=1112570 /ORGANISM="Thraustochytrium sp., Strain LLF1b" /LENGTH=300 /DNA_ID=CAMNT_0026906927 /DNA_START=170 /DNA_END=1072 /DNA_ORIENTATION=+
MHLAQQQARLAARLGQKSLGAVILDVAGAVIGMGRNDVGTEGDISNRAELVALRRAMPRNLEEVMAKLVLSACPTTAGWAEIHAFGCTSVVLPKGEIIPDNLPEGLAVSFEAAEQQGSDEVDVTVQALVLSPDRKHILLYQHDSGPFEGRWTGLISKVDTPAEPHQMLDWKPEACQVVRVIEALSQQKYGPDDIASVEQLARLEFYENDSSENPLVEFEHVVTLQREPDLKGKLGKGLKWFDRNEIPFSEMPRDDEVWYPDVLALSDASFHTGGQWDSKRSLDGVFLFQGKEMPYYHTSM